jgi:uncharacterized small protein (DUF1192 family)
MAGDNDEIFGAPPRKPASSHEIGQSLDELSVQEIAERITTLQAEITRLEEARRAKQTSLSAAAAFFKFGEPFEEKMNRLVATLREQRAEAAKLDAAIAANLQELGYGG